MQFESLWPTIAAGLPAYLERQRWYADKSRPIRSLELLDHVAFDTPVKSIVLALITIEYRDGAERRYFVPMTVHAEPAPAVSTIVTFQQKNDRLSVQDAPTDADFRDFLLQAGQGQQLSGRSGTFEFEPWQLDGTPFRLEPNTKSAAVALEQSNSSITYGKQAIAKLYRRLEPGQNIEVEMNRYLASEAHLRAVPGLLGCVTYHGPIGTVPLALVQQHVGDHRDCWSALTESLRSRETSTLDLVERLGTVTGEMHVALAAAAPSSPLAPEAISSADLEKWKEDFLRSVDETDRLIAGRIDSLPPRSAQAARNYLSVDRNWSARAQHFDLLAGFFRTRVHGDYHLGQVLVTTDGRLLIVDFEGEPQRPAHERAAKYSPLRDVAGMLRSLTYARGFAGGTPSDKSETGSADWFRRWEHDARERFLGAYRTTTAVSAVPIAPPDDVAFASAISVLEADKALYEIRYELNSRPDWAWLPLGSLL